MGWLFMKSLGCHSGPRQYLDDQFTYQRPEGCSRVLRPALVKMRVYYAAVEQVRVTGQFEVFALVCLVRYNPRDREGYIFGYKDMTEAMGPCESDCPTAILDLLTPTDHGYALAWRERCRTNAEVRQVRSAKPKPRPGQTIVFETPIAFANGHTFERLEVVAYGRTHRSVVFRDPQLGGFYRIPSLKTRDYRLIGEPNA